jgi:hypothetical protein
VYFNTLLGRAEDVVSRALQYDAMRMNPGEYDKMLSEWRKINQEDIKTTVFDKGNYKLPELEIGAPWDSHRITLDKNRGQMRLQQEGDNVLTGQKYEEARQMKDNQHPHSRFSYAGLMDRDPLDEALNQGGSYPTDSMQQSSLQQAGQEAAILQQRLNAQAERNQLEDPTRYHNFRLPNGQVWQYEKVAPDQVPDLVQQGVILQQHNNDLYQPKTRLR